MQTTHTTRTPVGLHWPIAEQPVNERLTWLYHANAVESARLARAGIDEELMMMRHPVSIKKAYALFGLLLGTLPPAAIFYRMFADAWIFRGEQGGLLLLILAMNVACSLAGWFFASKLSGMADRIERGSRLGMLGMPLVVGTIWGAGAGALGGLIFFGIGAFFGALCAIPVGLLAFAVFMPLHRWLSHDGMIEAAHLWPLACGVTMTITDLILGLGK